MSRALRDPRGTSRLVGFVSLGLMVTVAEDGETVFMIA